MRFFKTLTIGAAGYVLGARAGRGRYEQIKRGTRKIWDSGVVRGGRAKMRDQAAETFRQAQAAAAAKFHDATDAVKDRVMGDEDEIIVEEIRVEAVTVEPEE